MKRMVENSEKIEELADAVQINNDDSFTIKKPINFWKEVNISAPFIVSDVSTFGDATTFIEHATFDSGLTTSDITTPSGDVLYIINEEDYNITDSGHNMGIETINLGVAIVVSASIAVSEPNGEYIIMTFSTNRFNDYIGVVQMSGAPVCNVSKYINASDNTMSIKFTLNKNKAEYNAIDYYRFSFIVGFGGKSI